jgi:hypothetical protein
MYEHNRGRLEKRRCAHCMATGSWHAQKQHTRFRVRRVFTCISAVYICMLQKSVAWSCELSAGVRCPQSSHFFVRMPTAAVGQQEPSAARTQSGKTVIRWSSANGILEPASGTHCIGQQLRTDKHCALSRVHCLTSMCTWDSNFRINRISRNDSHQTGMLLALCTCVGSHTRVPILPPQPQRLSPDT